MAKKTETQVVGKDDVGTVPADIVKEGNKEVVQTQASINKSAIATAIFDECYKMNPVPQRKDILARVKKEADLTDAGAATYLQNYKRKHGLSKATTAAPAQSAAPEAAEAEGEQAE